MLSSVRTPLRTNWVKIFSLSIADLVNSSTSLMYCPMDSIGRCLSPLPGMTFIPPMTSASCRKFWLVLKSILATMSARSWYCFFCNCTCSLTPCPRRRLSKESLRKAKDSLSCSKWEWCFSSRSNINCLVSCRSEKSWSLCLINSSTRGLASRSPISSTPLAILLTSWDASPIGSSRFDEEPDFRTRSSSQATRSFSDCNSFSKALFSSIILADRP
mmetsp:Transcript_40241/g.62833  ORF Transcript_40241/g.62833 Transcript_40241/m.62833 type:complete len:216 (-) Transcript_40241:172-819(-)